VLGRLRLPEPEPVTDVVHRPRSCAKQLDDAKSIGFAQCSKGFSVHVRISSYTNIRVNEYNDPQAHGDIALEYYEDLYPRDARLLDRVSCIGLTRSKEAARSGNELDLCELEVVLKSALRKLARVEHHHED
jgi:hypothetical protein